MKKFLTAAAIAAVSFAASPAQANQDRLYDRFEIAALDCLDRPTKENCLKAAGAAKTFAAFKEKSNCRDGVVTVGMAADALAIGVPVDLTSSLTLARKYCATAK
jgi:hypothetical protein